MKLAKNDKFETYFESKKYFKNQLRVTPDELQIVAYIKRTIRKAVNDD